MKDTAVVLASGGMDSCVTATIAKKEYDLAMLHVQYGQKTEAREFEAFQAIATHLNAKNIRVGHLDHLKSIGGSSLTDESLPIGEADLQSQAVPTSYVPFRNAHLLAMAVSWAEVIGASKIFLGAVEEDSSGYPDCRKSFIEAFNHLIDVGTKPETKIIIETPLIDLSKAEIIRLGHEIGAPIELSWSCYRSERLACGHCDSCALRLRGFHQAGLEDLIPYEPDVDRHKFQ